MKIRELIERLEFFDNIGATTAMIKIFDANENEFKFHEISGILLQEDLTTIGLLCLDVI